MRNKVLYIFCFLFLFSCTSKFEDMNTDPTEVTDIDSRFLFTTALKHGTFSNWGKYQLIQSLYTNQYAQYWANTTNYFPTDRYTMNNGWIQSVWGDLYAEYLRTLNEIIVKENENVNRVQMARVLRAFIFHRMTDIWGPIPYSEASIGIAKPKYDTQEEIYIDLLKELDEASQLINDADEAGGYGSADLLYNGNAQHWKKLTNSLMLRLAIRVSKVDPQMAKEYGEKALERGVFTSNDDCAVLPCDENNREASHPIHEMAYWNEFRMSKAMEVYLNGDKLGVVDPRLKMYWAPAAHRANPDDEFDVVNFKGLLNGLPSDKAPENINTCSNVGPVNSHYSYDPVTESFKSLPSGKTLSHFLMTYAEVCFLKAEAAIMGWTGAGNADENYRNGIEASMLQWTVKNPSYAGPVPTQQEIDTYIDGVDDTVDMKAVITQKWLALFPDGFEGWAEFRRTGFPELIPVDSPDPTAGLNGKFIQRITYPEVEMNLNPNQYNAKVDLGEEMWWVK